MAKGKRVAWPVAASADRGQDGDGGLETSLWERDGKPIMKRWYWDRVCSIARNAPVGEAGW